MNGPAPEQRVIQPKDQHEIDLHRKIEGAIQPAAQKPIPLTEELKQIGVDATHIAGSTFDELMSGEGGSTRDRVASKNPINLVWEKIKRRGNSSAQKKAA